MTQKQCTVLIIEDSPEDQELYHRYLQHDSEYSYNILAAKQGKQGLEVWQEQQPDVVLLDYRLPDMDGLEFLKKLRLQFTSVKIPIIILTGQGDEAIAVQALKNGAQDYLVKGKLTTPKLCHAIHSALEKKQLIKQLWMQQQQQQILAAISLRIRQFLHLHEILQKTVQEVRELLTADRVIVYQFEPDMSGEIVAESVLPEWTPSLNCQIEDTCFRENQGIAYRNGKILAITDIYHAGLTDCHIQLLEKFEVKANLVVPILLNQEVNDQQNSSQQLWGLLITHQCNRTREWQENELDLLQQLSVQIAVAIKQAELYENLRTFNASLEKKVEERTQQLEASERKFRGIFNQSFQFTGLLTTEGILLEVNQTALSFGDVKLEDVINKPLWETYWWKISSTTQEQLKQAIARAAQGEFIRYEIDVLGAENQIATIDFSLRPLKDQFGKVLLLIPEGRDITERKQAETTLKIQAQILNEIHDAVVSTDVNGIIQTWNQPAQRIYGYTATEIIGQHISLLYFPEELAQLPQLVFQPLLKHGSYETELPTRAKSGKEIYISLRLSVMRDEQGNIIRLIGCSHDISKRKQAERALQQLNQELEDRVERRTAALRQSEQRFANLAAAAPVAIFRFDLDSNCVYVNDYWSKMMGRKAELALGQGWLESLHPDDRERLHQEYQQALQTTFTRGETYQNEARCVKPDGSIIWFYCQAVAETDSNGNIIGQIGTLTDITTRKYAEIALRESEEFNRSIFENNADCLKVLDMDGKIISMNQSGMVLMEVDDFDQVYGQEWVTLWTEPYQSAAIQALETAKSGNVGRFQGFCPTAKGTPKWWDVLVAAVPDSEGKPVNLIATSRDITVNKQAEKQLQTLSDRLQLAIKSAQLGIWDYDFISNSLVWDDRMYEIFGVSPQNFDPTEKAYEKFVQFIHPDDRVAFQENFQQAISLNQELNTEFRIIWPNGSIHIIKAYGIIQSNFQRQPQRMIGINLDITKTKNVESELRQVNERLAISNEELARATRLKDEFMANMSHELRTPLNAILGISEALQDQAFGVINEKQQRGLQTIERSGQHLLELINDILDLSKIEAGQMKFDYALIEISPLFKSSLTFIKQQAFQKRIQLDLKIEPNLPNLLIDERRIRQVLINLLNNAVKFTPEGGRITLEVTHKQLESTAEITSSQDFIRIAVIDTGIGIPPEHLNKLFQPFVQIDSSLNRKYEGTGLGLALVKEIVNIHGGQVGVTSEIGVGSCFTVDLPCGNISESTPNAVHEVSLPQNSTPISKVENSPLILLAEDHEANIFTISGYLESRGYRIILAQNGQEAIDLTKAELPDLILMDIQMPEVDGLEAIKQIRLDTNLTDIPIIALTALAMPGDKEKCLQAGANDYLAKPVKLKQLAITIQQLLLEKDSDLA